MQVAQYRAVLEEALRDHKRKKGNTPIDGQDRRPFSAVTADAQDNNTIVQTTPSLLGQAVSGHCQGTTFRCMARTGQGVEASSQFGAECALRTGSSAGQPRLASAAGTSGSGALSSWPTLPAEPSSAVAQQQNPRGPVPAALRSAQGSGCLQQQQQQQPDPLCPFGRRSVTCSSWGAGAAPVQEPTPIMGAPQRAPSPSPLPFERTSTCSYNGVPSSAPAPGPASSCLPFERGSACGYTPASSNPAAQATAAAPPSASPFARGSSCGYNYPNTSSNAMGALATWQQQLNGDGRAPAAPAASPFERTSSSFGASPAPPTFAAAPSASPFERGSACGYTANAAAGAAHAAVPALPSLSPAPITSQPLGRAPSMGPTAPLFTALDQQQQQHHHQHGAVAVLPGLDRTSTLSSSFMGATCGPASVCGCGTETDAEGKSYSPVPAAPPSPQLQLPSAASDGPQRGVTVGGRAVVLTPAAAADPLAATAAACLNTAAQQLKMLQQQQQQMLEQQQQLAAQQQILQQQIFRQRQEQQREQQQQEQEGRKGGSALQPELFPPIPASLLYQRLSAGRTEASAGSVASVTLLAPVRSGQAASAGGVSGAVHLSAGRQPAGPAPSVGSRPSPFAAPKPPAQQGTGPTAMVAAGALRGAVSINPNAAAAAVAAGGIAVQHGQRVAGGGMSLVRGPQPHLQQQQQMRLQQQQMHLQQMQVHLAASGAIGAVQSAVAACQQQEQEQEADRHLYEELLRALE